MSTKEDAQNIKIENEFKKLGKTLLKTYLTLYPQMELRKGAWISQQDHGIKLQLTPKFGDCSFDIEIINTINRQWLMGSFV